VAPGCIVALYGRLNTERFHPGLDASSIRARHGLEENSVLLTVGRLLERIGENGRRRVGREFRWEVLAAKVSERL